MSLQHPTIPFHAVIKLSNDFTYSTISPYAEVN
jgi:hypothetical protein